MVQYLSGNLKNLACLHLQEKPELPAYPFKHFSDTNQTQMAHYLYDLTVNCSRWCMH